MTCQPATADRPTQIRRRYPIIAGSNNGADCPSEVSQSKNCTLYPCVVLCDVDNWGPWSECSPALGWGQRTRTRHITQDPSPSETCPDILQIAFCYTAPPPSPCEWSTWFDWGDWSATCGYATRTRQRVLLSAPTTITSDNGTSVTYDLAKCSTLGATSQTQPPKYIAKCPVNCAVSKWSAWGQCTYPGYRYRTRSILVEPVDGGTACPDCLSEVDHCTVKNDDAPSHTCEVQPCLEEVL